MPIQGPGSRPAPVVSSPADQPVAKPAAQVKPAKADAFSPDVPRVTPVIADHGYPPIPVEQAINESIEITSPGAELPTPAEVAALKASGKDVVFSNLALREAYSLGDKADQFATREKVQGVVLSIDSYSSKDLDNALSFRREADGSLVVGVHAVDLSEWIRPGGNLDFAARRRVDTKYLDAQGLVLPMLPLSLSEGKLSLFEGQPRLTKSVELTYAPDGTFKGARIFRSQLVNTARLDDADAAKAARGEGRGAQNPELADALKSMTQLAAKVAGNKDPNAAMAMDKMLGFFTTASTKAVGDALVAAGLEASFRNQPVANSKSSYGSEAEGHASIGAAAYAQWTGPMRRYADLDTHRAMDRLIDGQKPDGRKLELDSRMRDRQLDRDNKVTTDAKLDYVKDLVDVTRVP